MRVLARNSGKTLGIGAGMKLTCPYPVFTQTVGSDSTVECKLGFLAREEISLCFWESVQVVGYFEAEAGLQK